MAIRCLELDTLAPDLRQRLAQLVRAFLHPLLERGVGFLQLSRHPIELRGEALHLIGRVNLDPVAELPLANPRGTGLQHLDGAHQPAREKDARDQCQGQARE